MNWANSMPSMRSGFEQFLLEHFGLYVDFSTNPEIGVVLMLIALSPFVFVSWSRKNAR